MKFGIAVLVALFSITFSANAACDGEYMNKDGGMLSIPKAKDKKVIAQMAFGGNQSPCPGEFVNESSLKLKCFTGEMTGTFSKDCGTLTYSGLTWNKK